MSQEEFELDEEHRVFLLEGYELLDRVEGDLVELENNPGDLEIVDSVFRAVHTIKGNGGFLGLSKLESLCHQGETVLDKIRKEEMSFHSDVATALLALVDSVRSIFNVLEQNGSEGDEDFSELAEQFKGFF